MDSNIGLGSLPIGLHDLIISARTLCDELIFVFALNNSGSLRQCAYDAPDNAPQGASSEIIAGSSNLDRSKLLMLLVAGFLGDHCRVLKSGPFETPHAPGCRFSRRSLQGSQIWTVRNSSCSWVQVFSEIIAVSSNLDRSKLLMLLGAGFLGDHCRVLKSGPFETPHAPGCRFFRRSLQSPQIWTVRNSSCAWLQVFWR